MGTLHLGQGFAAHCVLPMHQHGVVACMGVCAAGAHQRQ
jgi:hypothetical protein